MAIRAITPAMMQNRNVVNFESKKKDNTPKPQNTSSPIYKSVPLAVLIAMSPMVGNAQNVIYADEDANEVVLETIDAQTLKPVQKKTQSGEPIIEYRNFKAGKTGNPLLDLYSTGDYNIVKAVKKNNNKTDIEVDFEVDFDATDAENDLPIVSNTLANYKCDIVSDDGSVKRISFKNLHSYSQDSEYPILTGDKNMVNYVEELMRKYPTNTIKRADYNIQFGVLSSGIFEKQNNTRGNIMQNAKSFPANYGEVLVDQDFDGDKNKYNTKLVMLDNGNKFAVIIKKDGYPALKVHSVVNQTISFVKDVLEPTNANTDTYQLSTVTLADADGKLYNIIDNKLAKVLENFHESGNSAASSAFNFSSNHQFCTVDVP